MLWGERWILERNFFLGESAMGRYGGRDFGRFRVEFW